MDPWFMENRPIDDSKMREFLVEVRIAAERWIDPEIYREDTQAWVYVDESCTWLMLSIDFVSGNTIVRTLRLDVDAVGIRGGWSPSALSWDEGMPALEAGVDTSPPDGISLAVVEATMPLTQLAVEWLESHISRWAGESFRKLET